MLSGRLASFDQGERSSFSRDFNLPMLFGRLASFEQEER